MIARAMAGPLGVLVHVRWQASLSADARRELETRFHLVDGTPLDGTTWRYALMDQSQANVRALVGEPAAEDTHHIERRSYRVSASASRTPRPRSWLLSGDTWVISADFLAVLVGLAALVVSVGRRGREPLQTAVAAAAHRAVLAVRPAWALVAGGLTRGIPDVDARTAGTFRIVFGATVLAFFATHREDAGFMFVSVQPLVYGDFHARVLEWLARHPMLLDALTPWLIVTGAAFTIGLLTRATYALFVAGALIWAFVAVVHDSTHPNSVLIITLVALLPSRWGAAWSVDRWLTGTRRHQARPYGKAYGYSIWIPCLVFGTAFAAAAWAKLSRSGLEWILNGTVKYHFITDSFNAPVQWGLQLSGHPWLAIAASAGVLAAELLVITAAFVGSERYRLTIGAAAAATLAGFWLFMGVLWPAWWVLLLGFLPWRRLDRYLGAQPVRAKGADRGTAPLPGGVPGGASMVTAAQAAAVTFILGQQLVMSAWAVERAPMFTNYPMYSWTFASTDAFDAAFVPYYRIMVDTSAGDIELGCNATEDLVEDFHAALQGSGVATARVWRAVHACGSDMGTPRSVWLEGDRRVFDWQQLTLHSARAALIVGPLRADPGVIDNVRH
jgi:hypothetical protein